MNGGLQQYTRVLESVQPINAWPITPIDVEFYLNASNEEWIAKMAQRYGDDWEMIDG